MITYTPLWETMKQRRITTYALIKTIRSAAAHWTLSSTTTILPPRRSMTFAAFSPAAWRMCWLIFRAKPKNRNCPFPIMKWAVSS